MKTISTSTGFRLATAYSSLKEGEKEELGSVYSSRQLMARVSPSGLYCLRTQRMSETTKGYGGSNVSPFSMVARFKDWFNDYADYNISAKEAAKALRQFEEKYPHELRVSFDGQFESIKAPSRRHSFIYS